MRRTKVGAPITTTDWDDRKLGKDDCTAYSRCDFLCALDAETDMAVEVPDGNEGLKTSTLASASLFLHGHNLHDFILEVGEEEVDNLELLYWEREKIDLLHRFDLAVLYKTTELGNWDPSIKVITFKSNKNTKSRQRTNPSLHPCEGRDDLPDLPDLLDHRALVRNPLYRVQSRPFVIMEKRSAENGGDIISQIVCRCPGYEKCYPVKIDPSTTKDASIYGNIHGNNAMNTT